MDNTVNMSLKISASPHVRKDTTTSDIMFDVILALVPATVFGIYSFGWYAGLLVAVCILTSVAAEYFYQKGMKLKVTVGDLSATLTGLLIALNLPPEFPIWMAMIGCVFGIIVVKQLFGGLGQNFMNPALGARCFLLLAFSKYMTKFVYDGVTTATPLTELKTGGDVNIMDMFIGHTAGTIGETSAAALLVGAAYLLIKRVISPRIPVIYIGTFALCIIIYAAVKDKDIVDFTLAHLCGGGLMLGAWFMATDYVTSPITPKGKIIFGVMLGLLTFVLRIYGSSAEGVSYAIIISNLFVPLIEKVTVPKSFGYGADVKKDEAKAEKQEAVGDDSSEEKKQTPKKSFDGKSVVKAIAAIFVITLVMGAALGLVYNVTKDPIEKSNEKAKEEAYQKVMPDADQIQAFEDGGLSYDAFNEYLEKNGFDDVTLDEVCLGFNSTTKNIVGFIVVVTNSSGYGGDIQMAVGIDMWTGNITGVAFLEIGETVGLGMEAKNQEFLDQFIGKGVANFTYTKTGSTAPNEIDALSGATITTSAVTDGINAALRVYIAILQGGV